MCLMTYQGYNVSTQNFTSDKLRCLFFCLWHKNVEINKLSNEIEKFRHLTWENNVCAGGYLFHKEGGGSEYVSQQPLNEATPTHNFVIILFHAILSLVHITYMNCSCNSFNINYIKLLIEKDGFLALGSEYPIVQNIFSPLFAKLESNV